MCFSASASFIAGASLSAVGVATLRKTEQRSEIPFAMIPLLFGVQQITEGVVWLSFRFDAPLFHLAATYVYSVFSHVLWPVFVPFSIALLETVRWRHRVIIGFLSIGLAVGIYLLYFLVAYPVTAQVENHIIYISPHFYLLPVMAFYLAATCVSCFFSSHKTINIFGVLLLASFLAAYHFSRVTLVSVWCFFAAILSLVIYGYFNQEVRADPHPEMREA